jgi:putative FmdB family regulatory protein
MPTYDYECTKCEAKFELYQSITAKPKRRIATDCAQCKNSAPVRRLLGIGSGVIFKGSGFYETDYRSESYKKGAEAEKKAAEPKSTDSKSERKSDSKSKPDTTKAEPKTPKTPKKSKDA